MLPPPAPNRLIASCTVRIAPRTLIQKVDIVVEVKVLFGDFREGVEAEYPGVVDQNIQSSERRSLL